MTTVRLLALESSGLVASAAIVEDDNLIAEYTTNTKLTHSQTLLPMVDEIIKRTGIELASIDAIAVSAGPGSFTGLRIGAATAKGLCLALNKPLIPVPTLDALKNNVPYFGGEVVPIMDARRNQVYTLLNGSAQAMDMHDLIEELNRVGNRVVFLGDGVPVYRSQIEAEMTAPFEFAPAHLNRQRAASVGALAMSIPAMNADDFAPEYLRKSQAEREREERGQ